MACVPLTAAAFSPAIIAGLVKMVAHPKTFATLVTLRALDLRDQCSELLDSAGRASARPDRVAMGTDPAIVRLNVQLTVEIQAVAVAVQVGTNELAAAQDEVDAIGTGQECPGDGIRGQALRSFLFIPVDSKPWVGRNRNADGQPLLYGHHPHAFLGRIGGRTVRKERGQQPE